MNNINEILSPELQVKPLQEGEVREFRLALFGKIDPISNVPVRKPGHTLAGFDRIRDPFDKSNPTKQIVNISGHKQVQIPGGATIMEAIPAYLKFPSSMSIWCNHESNDQYFFMVRNNRNMDNPFRDRKKPGIFYMVDEVRDMNIDKVNFEYKMLSGGLLLTLPDQEILTLAASLNASDSSKFKFDTNLKPNQIRKVLQPVSQEYPAEFLYLTGMKDNMARVLADRAVKDRWIVLNENKDKPTWTWLRTAGAKGKVNILPVDKEDDSRKALISYLLTDQGGEHFAEMKARYEENYVLA